MDQLNLDQTTKEWLAYIRLDYPYFKEYPKENLSKMRVRINFYNKFKNDRNNQILLTILKDI